MTVPFVDLRVRDARLRREISIAVDRIIDNTQFVLGEPLAKFEQEFATYCGAGHCVGVANGAEALQLTLLALGIGPGDEVITADNTFVATAYAIAHTGASPVLVDVDPSDYLMDVELLERAITPRTKAILPVHLYGQPANLPAILEVADKHGLAVVQDACQAHGSRIAGDPIGSFGAAACYSFYPSKNLGAFGDGGAVVTNNGALADQLRVLRNCGQRGKNEVVALGFNSRLDSMQAAILSLKLPNLDQWNEQRRAIAALYGELLSNSDLVLPAEKADVSHVYHLYVVRHPERDAIMAHLREAGVECGIHYPTPIHELAPFKGSRTVPDGAPVVSQLAKQILSLPMFPGLTESEVECVAQQVLAFETKLAVL